MRLTESHPAADQASRRATIRTHLLYLAESVAGDASTLFREYTEWARTVQAGRGIDGLVHELGVVADVLDGEAVGEAKEGAAMVRDALATPPSTHAERGDDETAPLSPLAAEYLEALLRHDRRGAAAAILTAQHEGAELEWIYLDVLQPVLYEVGRRWQANQLSVATEHYCTAVTQSVISQLAASLFSDGPRRGSVVFACVGDELHQIGLRMVADLAELDGWDTTYLGANLPDVAVVTMLNERKADILALSVTFSPNLKRARSLIEAVRATDGLRRTKVIVGGYPFLIADGLWKRIGADAFGRDGRDARRMLQSMAS